MKEKSNSFTEIEQSDITKDKETLLEYMRLKRAVEPKVDEEFESNLFGKLMDSLPTESYQSKQSNLSFYIRGVVFAICLIITIAGIFNIFGNPLNWKSGSTRGIITVAQAKELLKKQLDSMFQPNTIYHQISTSTSYDDSGKQIGARYVGETWEDQNSPRSRSFGKRNNYTDSLYVNDGSFSWEYNPINKQLTKGIYVYKDPQDKERSFIKDDLVLKLKALLNSQSATVKEELVDQNEVISFYEEFPSEAVENGQSISYINIYTFDKETFIPLNMTTNKKVGNVVKRTSLIEFNLIENLPRTDELVEKLFKFDYKYPENTDMTEWKWGYGANFDYRNELVTEVNPVKYVIRSNNLSINLNVSSNLISKEAKGIIFGQFIDNDSNNEFIEKYPLSNINTALSENAYTVIAAEFPKDIPSGKYHIKVNNPDGTYYITKDTVEVINQSIVTDSNVINDVVGTFNNFPCVLSSQIDINSRELKLVSLEVVDGIKQYVDRYSFKDIQGSYEEGKNSGTLLCGTFPENVKQGIYYLKVINPDNSEYITQESVDVIN